MRSRVLRTILVASSLVWPSILHAGAPTPFAPPPKEAAVLYRGATLIDGTGAPPRPDMDVLVEGDRITQVVADSKLDPAVAARARVVDLRGRYLIPGLIDSHVHLATPPNRRQAEAMLRRDLYGGVTAVRDMADDLRPVSDLTRASLVGEIAASDIYYAALMAGPDFFSDARTVQTTAGGRPGQVPWMQAITDKTDLPLAVAEARGAWATAIKLYADLSGEQAGRIAAEAHRQHLLVWAHATLYPAKPSELVAAGVDSLSHACLFVREAEGPGPAWAAPRKPVSLEAFRTGENPDLARVFADMARRGTVLDATLWTYSSDTEGSTTLPPLAPGSCDDTVGGAITRQAYRAGVQISAGTDNVAAWTDAWPDLFHELEMLSTKAGMSNAAILTSATLIGARATGQEHDMGAIAPGKLANMVVLARDPLKDLANLRSVVMTLKRGRAFYRTDFVPLSQADIVDR